MRYLRQLLVASSIGMMVTVFVVGQQRPAVSPEEKSICPQAPLYKMGAIAHSAPDYPRELLIYISVEPEHFAEKDMRELACALRNKFPAEPRFAAIILDDEYALKHTSPIHRTKEYLAARRAYYHVDRTTGEEYITFSKARGKPISEIKIDLTKHE